ncbi:hypothetical protein JG687_00008459 [Phytophthora cactorum]|uniref:P-loop containing nucleoside triphosphate hydrolase n=2 Tax=Phytophthora TaxID=4783 RepID=A0A8T1UCB7_9STRA|nr:hypothetical protein JG687_00008459 [Phytophthora cactorum]
MFDKESLIQFVAGSGCFSIIQMILLIVLGALLVDDEHYHQLLGSSIRDVGGGLIFTGVFYLFAALLGFATARTKNKCLLLAQLTLLVFLLFFQTVMGGVALAASRAPGLALSYEAQVICLTVGKYEALSDKDKQTCQHFFRSDEFAGAMLVMEEIGLPPVVVDEEPLVPVTIETKTDLYAKYKSLERHLEFLDIQEGYIKDEMKNLKRELIRAKEEVKRIQSVPLVIGQFLEMVDANYGIVGSTAGSNYYVRILSTLDRERLKPNSSVALHRHSHAVVDVLPPESDSSIQMMQMSERPDVSYSDIGGMDIQKQEVREALLNQMDGFDQATNVKVIMATNRADTLDPALLRPGRLDRKIEFPLPDRRQKRLIYQACTAKMNLGDEVDLEDYVNRPEKISSADIASICQEAGLQAVRKNRYVVLPKDFDKGYKNAIKRADTTFEFYH